MEGGIAKRYINFVLPSRKDLKPLLARQVEAHTAYRSGSQKPGTTNQIRHKAPKRVGRKGAPAGKE
ncbi:hypothetical protein CPAR01_09890 [Colletotrichum paranaense]|uniref:Uncharacterized protein n=2 Tax=Colletotrichum acutatum species complex TaxID=2707335 RepID=A0AAI9XPA8_9PEZI|nr:uncharacterized protein CPAR01_09890 [Colletotrichum paranaense]KAK1458248.1 hypothetical protein CMEL01_15595 [Colletotrichum melonis]KAK1533182.1 hypothetical protein CPAR01_09890 [Colletotrichum paranaense]